MLKSVLQCQTLIERKGNMPLDRNALGSHGWSVRFGMLIYLSSKWHVLLGKLCCLCTSAVFVDNCIFYIGQYNQFNGNCGYAWRSHYHDGHITMMVTLLWRSHYHDGLITMKVTLPWRSHYHDGHITMCLIRHSWNREI